jgi:hypothetical protein
VHSRRGRTAFGRSGRPLAVIGAVTGKGNMEVPFLDTKTSLGRNPGACSRCITLNSKSAGTYEHRNRALQAVAGVPAKDHRIG